ncbi:MAG: hypothetical protein ACRC0A_02975 [Chitinophagaceae bacterium]
MKKIIEAKAVGCMATYDLQICNMGNPFSKILTNKCFEVSISNDRLNCDYKLKESIFKSKSAIFLIQQVGIL